MALPNPYSTYQTQSILTAPPGELTLMLYNGCLKFMKQGLAAIETKDIERCNSALGRAQDIICELISSLDLQYDVANNLYALYDFLQRSLIDANIRQDTALIVQCIGLITELRETWAEAVQMTRVR